MTASASAFAPDWASPPGDTLRDVLNGRGLTVDEAAVVIGVPVREVERLLSGEAEITVGLAQNLSASIGATAQFWINRECAYRDGITRRELLHWVSQLPTKEMTRRGWLPSSTSDIEVAQLCLDFFQVPDVASWRVRTDALSGALYRTSRSYTLDDAAALVWLQQSRRLAFRRKGIEPWNDEGLRSALLRIRRLTFDKDPSSFLPKVEAVLAQAGVRLVVLQAPKGCPVSGASLTLEDGSALIALTARHLSDDHLWFTLFHEAAHLLLHGRSAIYLDAIDERHAVAPDKREAEADALAAELLVPRSVIDELPDRRRPKSREIVRAAVRHKVAPGIVVGHLQHEGILGFENLNSLKRRYRWNGSNLERA